MTKEPIDRVKARHRELGAKIAKLKKESNRLKEEWDRLDAYLQVHKEFSRPLPQTISGKQIDALCQMVLRHSGKPMTSAQLVNKLKEQFGAVIDAASPTRLVSTRMSTLTSVKSTEDGWRLLPNDIKPKSEAYTND